MEKDSRLKFFPVPFFAVVMWLSGLIMSIQKGQEVLWFPQMIDFYLLMIVVALFVLFLVVYLLKFVFYKQQVLSEINHPIKISFFGAVSISFILLSVGFDGINDLLAHILLWVWSVLHLFITFFIISLWMHDTKFEVTHMSPAWFIPVVGNILIPIVWVSYLWLEISWFFFSIWIVFWLVLLVIFFNRIIFYPPIPEKLLPTLFILIAPPAVGFVSWYELVWQIDQFWKILYYISLFFLMLLIFQSKIFMKINFYLSWWAYTFPIAAVGIASMVMYDNTWLMFFELLSYVLFFALVFILIIIVFLTFRHILNKKICVEEG